MAYGLSASAVGNDFPWIFNPPATYWDGMSMIIKYIAGKEGGLDKLKGKTIGFIYPRQRLRPRADPAARAVRQGLRLQGQALSGAGKEMQNQSAHWLNVRRDRPAWMIMWGWGAMNPTAVKEAAEINYPMDHFIGIWWSGSEDDARPAGAGGKGYLSLNFNRRRRQLSGASRTS